ncbi:methyl-accepting chemotaxis protein [Metapseudomonas resinovorans]|uniref:Putative methyl-accepting chemotaxis transducer n=1 Tax=Metapseudomonas resinovorans NBRC 106553 TaxID=1245471 RepID=S6AEB1_METRE|nr:methyl-accepting chemotaxis protein [Pseudomonas resinovorans]BAN47922.1 putative methyl-accepting chemotaxis transducer [Pseudomonas resinovorans NBRC 106553]
MYLRQLPIAYRAAVGFAIITLLLVGLGWFASDRMEVINQASTRLSQISLPSVQAANRIGQVVAEVRLAEMAHLLARDPASWRGQEQRLNELAAELRKAEEDFRPLVDNAEEQALFDRLEALTRDYLAGQPAVLERSRSGDAEGARVLMRDAHRDRYVALLDSLQALSKLVEDQAHADNLASDLIFERSSQAVLVVLLVALLASVAIAWLLTRSIVQPIRNAMLTAQKVADGDLTGQIDTHGKDEPAHLMQSLEQMQRVLHDTIEQIGQSATQLASAAEELNAVTEEGSHSLTRQHSEIEMAATAVNQMSAAVEEVARNAASTSEASSASEGAARTGRERVEQTVQAIRDMGLEVTHTTQRVADLAVQAQGISRVLDVIRAIAEQTNLLALNAAIEAARAGEQGRGFAVVADEVRALAHRTQESTHEIEQMIAGIQAGADTAVAAMRENERHAQDMLEVAEGADQALFEIARQAGEINERTLVIASAAEEQAQVAREVDRNLVNIHDISVQTSAGAGQTSTASHELSRLANDLNGMIARFVV